MSETCLIKPDSNDPDKEPQIDKKEDYYTTDVPEELLKHRNDYILKRREQLQEFYLKYTNEMVKYLLYVNAGGVVTILAFMGTSESIRNLFCLRIALLFYALGLLSVGVFRALLLIKIRYLFESWRKEAEKYWAQHIGYNKLMEEDDNRSGSGRIFWIVGSISGGLAILGLTFGVISLFGQC